MASYNHARWIKLTKADSGEGKHKGHHHFIGRDSHVLPMRQIRSELIGQVRRSRARGQTAARLKRMPSIRRKLQKISVPLSSIQDLAGCRAILPTLKDVNAVIKGLRQSLEV
jgi:hypothetical protein